MSWEVRTMRSATSCFNLTLLRKNLARFWPIWVAVRPVLAVRCCPSICCLNGIHVGRGHAPRSRPCNYLDGGPSAAVALTALFGLLCAMAVFSYLYASRSVGMLHALPLRREGLFLTNYLSGLSCSCCCPIWRCSCWPWRRRSLPAQWCSAACSPGWWW